VRPTPEDDPLRFEIRWVRACDPIPEAFKGFHHDHDEELGMYWYDSPEKERLERPFRHPRLVQLTQDRPDSENESLKRTLKKHTELYDLDYWLKTGNLVREYLKLRAGSDTLRQDLIAWVQHSPERRYQYEKGDDERRAILVDWFLGAHPQSAVSAPVHDHDDDTEWCGSDDPETEDSEELDTEDADTMLCDATPDGPHRRDVDVGYWLDTLTLVKGYLRLQAGSNYSDDLYLGFLMWVGRWPAERRAYINGDDMQRAALVDWYLKVVR
jgi:hypothetical protein